MTEQELAILVIESMDSDRIIFYAIESLTTHYKENQPQFYIDRRAEFEKSGVE